MSEALTKELPDEWEVVPLTELLIQFETGTRPKGGVGKYTEGVPSIGAEHLNAEGGFKFEKIKFVPEEYATSMKRGHLQEGDILVVKDGATTAKTSLVRKSFPHKDAVINEHVFRCKVNKNIESAYIFYYLFSGKGQKEILSDFRGAAQGGISKGFTDKVNIPLAPHEQQKRIVAKIEELFSHIDAGIEALKKAKQLLKQYRQSVLKAAVTGELTKEWREANKDNIEPASQLLERILKERRQKWEEKQLEQFKAKGKMPKDGKWKEKYKEPVQVVNVAELEELPSTWEWGCLDSVIVDGPHNGLYLPKTKYGGGVPIIRIDDFQDGYIRAYDYLQKVNANKSEVKTYSLQIGDLVINRVNSPTHLGKCMVVKEGYEPCLFESNMMKAELSLNITSDYIDYYIQSTFGRSKLIRNAKWAVNQASINQQDVRSTEITLPPFEEQNEITQVVSEKFDVIDRLNNELDIQLCKAEKNRQSILASAFSGNL
ncbi:MAG: restriction endonuclease subunit S [Gammaproteobacteria bacterium]